jgi:hypothetical protein
VTKRGGHLSIIVKTCLDYVLEIVVLLNGTAPDSHIWNFSTVLPEHNRRQAALPSEDNVECGRVFLFISAIFLSALPNV